MLRRAEIFQCPAFPILDNT